MEGADVSMSTTMDVVRPEEQEQEEEEETYNDNDESASEVEQAVQHVEPHSEVPPEQHPAHTTTTGGPETTAPTADGAAADAPSAPVIPAKRPRGRPKGSGKKQRLEAELAKNPDAAAAAAVATAVIRPQPEPKVRRPVGRPRKDGLPAGSLLPPREKKPMGRPRKSAPAAIGSSGDGMPSSSVFPVMTPVIDPQLTGISAPPRRGRRKKEPVVEINLNMSGEEWKALLRNNPDAFLRLLIMVLAPLKYPPASAGPNVQDAFRNHLQSLTPKDKDPTKSTTTDIPSLYSIMKTFWLPTSPSYFALTASATTRTPSEHRFLYWDPLPLLFNGLQCPNCNSGLSNRGRIRSGPVQVYDLGKPFYIIGCEYACTNDACKQASGAPDGLKFASTDASILRALPVKLKDEFPAHLVLGVPGVPTRIPGDLGTSAAVWNWQALGVSTALWNMVRGCLAANVSKEAIQSILKGIYEGLPEEEEQSPLGEGPDSMVSSIPPAGLAQDFTGAAGLQILQPPTTTPAANGVASTSAPLNTPPATAPVPPMTASSSSAGKDTGVGAFMSTWSASTGATKKVTRFVGNGNENSDNIQSNTDARPPLASSGSTSSIGSANGHGTPSSETNAQSRKKNTSSAHATTSKSTTTTNNLTTTSPQVLLTAPPPNYPYIPPVAAAGHFAFPYSYGGYNQLTPYAPYIPSTGPTKPAGGSHPIPGSSVFRAETTVPTAPPASSSTTTATITGASTSHSTAPPANTPASGAGAGPGGNSINPAGGTGLTELSARRMRHCCKCGSQDCKGKGGRHFCTNPCQDCGSTTCPGRNSKRPEKRCHDAWP